MTGSPERLEKSFCSTVACVLQIKREALVKKVMASYGPQREMDRQVRKAIEELRASGWLIGPACEVKDIT